MKDYDYILQVLDDTQFQLKYGEIYVSNISEQYKPEDDIWEKYGGLDRMWMNWAYYVD